MDYAGRNQDVFAGYGKANRERLRNISKNNDPVGVFQRRLSDGTKLFPGTVCLESEACVALVWIEVLP